MNKLTTFARILIGVVVAVILGGAVYYFAPGLRVSESKVLSGLKVGGDVVNNVDATAKIPLPGSGRASTSDKPLVRWAGYAWNAQSALIAANGGPKTTEGSIMEANGVNLEIIRQDWLTELRNQQLKFVEEFDKGEEHPVNGVSAIIIMGDGGPFYVSTTQQALDDKYGKGKYHLQVYGAVGLSYGEDKLIGPAAWKKDPKLMKGALISAVLGDGDWVTAVNFAFSNGLKVNPDPKTYDSEAVNFYPSESDDYINSAKELIKSQSENFSVPLKEVKDGKLTGKTINKKIDACATWTPGDKLVFDALTGYTDIISTRDYPNQMATTIIGLKEWGVKNMDIVSKILKSSYTAANQIKQHDEWAHKAAECVDKTFQVDNTGPEYWYKMFKGQSATKAGISYDMGGSRVFTYADAKQYYGIGGGDGVKRYKAVYEQVSGYLTDLNPFDFNTQVKRVVPYEEVFTPLYLNNISDVVEGESAKIDYSSEATAVMASGDWTINFASGSANLLGDSRTQKNLKSIYNLLIQAEQTKLNIVGHTDTDGNDDLNMSLSKARAQAVVKYLQQKGVSPDRFQIVDGKGETQPKADNVTATGKAQNRRVQITLLQ
jgi:OmpA-OmpF porin, OOP family